ncbi:MAG: hypothetical protein JWP89_271 [Schlesneria sp.]|nr:hypothetical protein [Schlesneria sp.]
MGVMMLDYGHSFDRESLSRLADAGCKDILLFDYWCEHEPEEGRFTFDPLLEYSKTVRELGMSLRVQTPVGVPLWCPRDWFLTNAEGVRSDFYDAEVRYRMPLTEPLTYEYTITRAIKTLSYWNADAEAHLVEYVRRLRQAVESENATCICSIGSCGEYLFPPVYFYPFLGAEASPWWFDEGAERSWLGYCEGRDAPDRSAWLLGQLGEITQRRLSLFDEKWLQYVPYYQGWGNFGNDNVDVVLDQNANHLRTILFSVFHLNFPDIATVQAAKFPTWGGAEGAANIVTNSRRAYELGLKGVVCGPLWFNYASGMETWMYEEIRKANEYWEAIES